MKDVLLNGNKSSSNTSIIDITRSLYDQALQLQIEWLLSSSGLVLELVQNGVDASLTHLICVQIRR